MSSASPEPVGAPRPIPPRLAIVALGANLGDPPAQFRQAALLLREWAEPDFRLSTFHSSEPLDCPPGSPRFLNAVATFTARPGLTPETLLPILQSIETRLGRQPKILHNEARPLDLDLIAFGPERRATPLLTLPHPRAHLRPFVLAPLAELHPELLLPGWLGTVAECLGRLAPP